MISRPDIELQIVLVSHRLYERGFVTATDGNVSARLESGTILVTPSGVSKRAVAGSDLVEVNSDGSPITLSRKPSSELPMHLFIYSRRPDVKAIVHAHPPYATGFATARLPFPEDLFPEVILGLGKIPLAPYATPSTPELPASLEPYVREANAILLANHGVVTFGADLEEASQRMEKVEHAAHILFVARMLGGEHPLTPTEIERLKSAAGRGIAPDPVQGAARSVNRGKPSGGNEPSEQEVRRFIKEVLEEKSGRSNA